MAVIKEFALRYSYLVTSARSNWPRVTVIKEFALSYRHLVNRSHLCFFTKPDGALFLVR
jgi:hypothetical protein